MRPTALKLTAGLLLFCGLSSTVKAQVEPINVVTTAVPFLRISPDSRSGGMGELSNRQGTPCFFREGDGLHRRLYDKRTWHSLLERAKHSWPGL